MSLLPSTTEILFALGAGDDVVGVTFECDTPAEARSRTIVSTSAMPVGPRRPPRSTRTSRPRWRAARTSTTSPPTRCARPRPDARGHPGPVRGLRGRRHHGRRRARAPRLHGGGAHRRPAHARGGARLGRCCWAGPPATRRPRPSWSSRCGSGWPPCWRSARWAAAARGSPCSSGPTRRTPPATGSPRWSSSPAATTCSAPRARSRCASPGTTSPPPGPDVVVVAPCGYDRAGAQAQADARRADLLPAGVPRARGRRGRHVGPARPPAGRRRRGARRGAAPGLIRASGQFHARHPTRRPATARWRKRSDVVTAGGQQPGDQRVRVPHVTQPELVTTPSKPGHSLPGGKQPTDATRIGRRRAPGRRSRCRGPARIRQRHTRTS